MADIVRFPPSRMLPLIRQLDFGETDRYVQAVIKNVSDLATTLATKNLTHQGSPNGYYNNLTYTTGSDTDVVIQVVISVYTDSGYTAKDANYPDTLYLYHIMPDTAGSLVVGGGGTQITEEDWENLARRVWEYQLKTIKNENSAAQTLIAASQEIENVDLTPIQDKLDTIVSEFPQLRGSLGGSVKGIVDTVNSVDKKLSELQLSDRVADRKRSEIVDILNGMEGKMQMMKGMDMQSHNPQKMDEILKAALELRSYLAALYQQLFGKNVEISVRLNPTSPVSDGIKEAKVEIEKIQKSLESNELGRIIDNRLHEINHS